MPTTDSIKLDNYIDLNYIGYNSSTGSMVLTGINAIKNVIKMYLLSQIGDYGRNLSKGGPLLSLIGKPMRSEDDVKKIISDSLKIFSNIFIDSVEVKKELTQRLWVIKIIFSDSFNKTISGLTLGVPL